MERPPREEGLGHVLAAARYSLGGARRLWRETAFRHETLAFAGILVLFLGVGAPLWGLVGAALLFLVTVAVEALNTAVEVLTDHASPGYSQMAGYAKDLGSFAVFCLLIANGIWVAYVLAATWGWAA
ncbi:diacylglycerol kinase [Hoeflea olei]|uniref:Diacylglycerol kinase n=1 Tax=Hoeflea olei TaxID=1480615 RepID=A0A1C1YQQ9_9HYPH|nr:diacylglycerol kinase [Hoeflea olei]OCW55843.1 diacylglycerol kinase [Hoeflea olei]